MSARWPASHGAHLRVMRAEVDALVHPTDAEVASASSARGWAWLGGLDGWEPDAGRSHPTGGYERRRLIVLPGSMVLEHLGPAGELHREDGPARVTYDHRGVAMRLEWVVRGQHHRTDGFALVCAYPGAVHEILLHARPVGPARASTVEDFLARTDAGMSARAAVSWAALDSWVLAEPDASAEALVAELGRSPLAVDPDLALVALRAGERDPRAVRAVATRRAPASWALRL